MKVEKLLINDKCDGYRDLRGDNRVDCLNNKKDVFVFTTSRLREDIVLQLCDECLTSIRKDGQMLRDRLTKGQHGITSGGKRYVYWI